MTFFQGGSPKLAWTCKPLNGSSQMSCCSGCPAVSYKWKSTGGSKNLTSLKWKILSTPYNTSSKLLSVPCLQQHPLASCGYIYSSFSPTFIWEQRRKASLVAQTVKRLSAMQETRVRSLGWEDPLEKEMAAHSGTVAWKTPWTEEPGRLQSMGLQRVRHDWATSLSLSEEKQWRPCVEKL